ncbi:hypothetical protein AHMF7605_00830 [Adhaeribacter arboris]|uniref:Uncharacterized protein n=1 Tax=Adhaeribacter arboris TaxID=2072846 RepID=A0A2T2Y9J7_9BACT|nr:hypothetical protein AHMF7605_00830 [Adhaeribacter arboris]
MQNVRNANSADISVKVDNSNIEADTLKVVRELNGPIKINNDKNAAVIRINEKELIESGFNLTHEDVRKFVKGNLPHVKMNDQFHALMKKLEKDQNICYQRPQNPLKPNGSKMKLYSDIIYQALIDNYPKPDSNEAA